MAFDPIRKGGTFIDDGVQVTLPSELVPSVLREFAPYKTWRATLRKSLAAQSDPSHPFHTDPYQLRSIDVQSCDFFGGGRLGFLKLKANVTNGANEKCPGSLLMRGGSVAMLIVLDASDSSSRLSDGREGGKSDTDRNDDDDDDKFVILTVQPRIPAGSLSFVELPAGMIDDSGSFGGAAAKEIKEETGLDIKEAELIDLTKLALEYRGSEVDAQAAEEEEVHLQQAVYPSPGGCDEFIPIFLARRQMPRDEIDSLRGRLTGLRDSGEKITLKICRLRELWKVGARDGKTLAALALYDGLRKEGRI